MFPWEIHTMQTSAHSQYTVNTAVYTSWTIQNCRRELCYVEFNNAISINKSLALFTTNIALCVCVSFDSEQMVMWNHLYSLVG